MVSPGALAKGLPADGGEGAQFGEAARGDKGRPGRRRSPRGRPRALIRPPRRGGDGAGQERARANPAPSRAPRRDAAPGITGPVGPRTVGYGAYKTCRVSASSRITAEGGARWAAVELNQGSPTCNLKDISPSETIVGGLFRSSPKLRPKTHKACSMKKMIILRSNKSVPSDTVPVSTLTHNPGELSIQVQDLSPKDEFSVQRDPQVIGAAPPMPVQLIRATEHSAALPTVPPAISWGVQAVGAAGSAFSGEGVTVAVLDTGIDAAWKTLPAFLGVEIETKNFTDSLADDRDGHGTHCAGTIFGRETDGCRIGVAPGIGRALIGKVIGPGGGSTDAIFKAMLWAYQNGAQVISMSLGMDFPGYQEELSTFLPKRLATSMALAGYRANVRLFDRISQITSARDGIVPGAVVVAAAGNESQRDIDPRYRITVATPAAAELFLSVAALEQDLTPSQNTYRIAPFSNTGARISAPGVNIYSAKIGGGLVSKSGTSMATPHVAGVAALWIERSLRQGRPFRASHVIDQIERSSVELPHLDPDDVGLGLVQAP